MPFDCQLVVADLVGTTLEDDGAVEAALKAAVDRHGLRWRAEDFARLRGRTKMEAISAMLAAQGGSRRDAASVHAAFIDLLAARYRERELRWISGAEAAFREVAARGIRTVLATGFPAAIREILFERVPWRDCLTAFLSADDVRRGRPAPDLVWEAMRRAGIADARRVAVVGDTPADVACGRAAGAGLVIAVTNGASPPGALEAARPDLLLPSVAQLSSVLLPQTGRDDRSGGST